MGMSRDEIVGSPCPFLKTGQCSIYRNRPLPCRMHFNMADTSYMCRMDIPPEQTWVPRPKFDQLDAAVADMFGGERRADVREFFGPR
jgi:Fe-S-cluster containining protein